MASTTTPDPDHIPSWASAEAKLEFQRRHRHARPGEGPASGRTDDLRLILNTDQLLGEVLKRPGQLFVVVTPFDGDSDEWRAFIEFADGSQVEVQRA